MDAGFGRKLRGLKVTSAELGEYVERLVRHYVEQRTEDERFAQWVARADEEHLK
jgi:sulfite reductase (ferredoxin)